MEKNIKKIWITIFVALFLFSIITVMPAAATNEVSEITQSTEASTVENTNAVSPNKEQIKAKKLKAKKKSVIKKINKKWKKLKPYAASSDKKAITKIKVKIKKAKKISKIKKHYKKAKKIFKKVNVIKKISSPYVYSPGYLRTMGVLHWGGWRWTWYSQRVLPGGGLRIPGRHVDNNGYICDQKGYICLASGSLSYGTIVKTPFGKKGKVYDSGCASNTLDVYVDF